MHAVFVLHLSLKSSPLGPGPRSLTAELLQVQEAMQQIAGPLVAAQSFLPGPE